MKNTTRQGGFLVMVGMCSLLTACEVTRQNADEPAVREDSPEPLFEAQVEDSPEPPFEAQVEEPRPKRVVDKRTTPPVIQSGVLQPLERLKIYKPGFAPSPARPEAAVVTVDSGEFEAQAPALLPAATVGPLRLEPARPEWEPYLLSAGLRILDRQLLPTIEREHFRQSTSISANVFEAMFGRAIEEGLIWREPFPESGSPFWSPFESAYRPLLNGYAVEKNARISAGKVLPAGSILHLGEIEAFASDLVVRCMAPSAEEVPYVPVFDGYALPRVPAAEWEPSWEQGGSKFHFIGKDSFVFYDPERNALWSLDQAWIGGEVSRSDYISRRTSMDIPNCEGCGRQLHDEAKESRPDSSETPRHWKCEECGAQSDVVYLDGFYAPSQSGKGNAAIIGVRWLKPMPGCFPVWSIGPSTTGPGAAPVLALSTLDEDGLGVAVRNAWLADGRDGEFCHVRPSGTGLLVTLSESKRVFGDVDHGLDGRMPIPVTDNSGTQVYLPAFELTKEVTVAVPIEAARVRMRLIDVETTELLASGVLSISFAGLLEGPSALSVDVDGLDLSDWPSREAQQDRLRVAVRERLAGMLAK